MKRTLLFAAAFGISLGASAQISIGQWDIPTIGMVLQQAQDTVPTVSAGSAGANQTYTATGLNSHVISTLTFTDPAWTPDGAQFPSSNLALDINGGSQYIYMTRTSANLVIDGIKADLGAGPMVIANDDPETLLEFPLQYLDSYNDISVLDEKIDATAFGQPGVDSARIKQHHDRTYTVDGWGTVTTPLGTFDCLRQHTFDIQTDTIWAKTFGTWIVASTQIDTLYGYQFWTNEPSTKFIVVEMTVDENDNVEEVNWLMSTPATNSIVENKAIEIGIYPNPVNDIMSIELSDNVDRLVIVDVTGKEVLSKTSVSNGQLNVSALKSGIYFLSAYDGDKVKTSKFIKQ